MVGMASQSGGEQPQVAVLLSTYNGATYLPELISSLQSQTVDFFLIWRDDGSSDDSKEIIINSGFTSLIECEHADEGQNIGAVASFGATAQKAIKTPATFFCFCDQDDIWDPRKLERLLERASLCSAGPRLWHHDLVVVDSAREIIHPSFWRYMALETGHYRIEDLVSRNAVTGCAMMMNRALLERSLPIPTEAIMHDWWFALVAVGAGNIETVEDCLVEYRQHESNTIGAKGFFHGLNPFTNWVKGWQRGNQEYRSLFPQAQALQHHLRVHGLTSAKTEQALAAFLSIPDSSVVARLGTLRLLGLRGSKPLLWLIAAIRVLTTSVDLPD